MSDSTGRRFDRNRSHDLKLRAVEFDRAGHLTAVELGVIRDERAQAHEEAAWRAGFRERINARRAEEGKPPLPKGPSR